MNYLNYINIKKKYCNYKLPNIGNLDNVVINLLYHDKFSVISYNLDNIGLYNEDISLDVISVLKYYLIDIDLTIKYEYI